MGDATSDPSTPPSGSPQKCLPKRLAEKAINEAKQVPAHIAREINLLVGDVQHARRGDLHKVSFDTQIWLAKKAKALATGDQTFGLPVPVPAVPNLTIVVNFKDISAATKGKPEGVMLQYEVYRW